MLGSSSWDMNWNELINTAQIFLQFSHQFITQCQYVCSIKWLLIIPSQFKSSSTKNDFRLTTWFISTSKDFTLNGQDNEVIQYFIQNHNYICYSRLVQVNWTLVTLFTFSIKHIFDILTIKQYRRYSIFIHIWNFCLCDTFSLMVILSSKNFGETNMELFRPLTIDH